MGQRPEQPVGPDVWATCRELIPAGSVFAFLAEHLGFSRAGTVAFGDGENDVELLDWAAYGVAVANAHERVLAVADLVCPPVDEEGVAQVIEAFLDFRRR